MSRSQSISAYRGSKAYFTGFDYLQFNHKRAPEIHLNKVERTLKLLLLSKNHVVCPMSHLYTPLIYDFLKANPAILERNLIVPAQRTDVADPAEFLRSYEIGTRQAIHPEKKRAMLAFFEHCIDRHIPWEGSQTIERFKQSLLSALKNPSGVLFANFEQPDRPAIDRLILEIENAPVVNRYILKKLVRKWDATNKSVFINYINLLYHRIGAHTVDLECSLPVTAYVDYSFKKLSGKDILLSERDILIKLLFERMFCMLALKPINAEHIDGLNYNDIHLIRQRLTNSDFTESYEQLLQNTLSIMNLPEKDLSFDLIEKPLSLLQRLSAAFDEICREQIAAANKKRNLRSLTLNGTSLLLDGAGFAPVAGNLLSAGKMILSAPDVIFNLFFLIRNRKQLGSTEIANELKDKKIKSMIKNSGISGKSYFFDAIKLINDVSDARRQL